LIFLNRDWDGVNQYEKQRATKLSQLGYVAFAADIFGAGLQEIPDISTRANLTRIYRSNMTLFVQRIQRAIDQVKTYDFVDTDNIAVIGYCFGGTGIIQLAFSGNSDVKVVVSFHGGLTSLPNVTTDIMPYTLM
jgi:dienelactone hydrolase